MAKLNKETKSSRYAAIILFIGIIPALAFYIGVQYGKVVTDGYDVPVFIASDHKVIRAR